MRLGDGPLVAIESLGELGPLFQVFTAEFERTERNQSPTLSLLHLSSLALYSITDRVSFSVSAANNVAR